MTYVQTQVAKRHASEARWATPKTRGSGWLEWRLDAPTAWKAFANPYDPALADITVEFVAPDGRRVTATAFWIKDSLFGSWAVRLLPHVAGHWKATSKIRINGEEPVALGEEFAFAVARVPDRRRIVVDPKHPGYFAFEDGSPFVPIGLNIGWSTGTPIEDYRRWFKRLAENGGNFARIWMASWSFAIEWNDTGLGNYDARQDRASHLDRVFELAEEYGIRIMLCLLNHGAFTEANDSEWKDNPYNKSNGGPLSNPDEFVTNGKARELFARRVRYIAARWSHSPALHSWEWWNEVTWTPIDNDKLIPWIREMSKVLDQHDPYRRLRTTSWADRGYVKAWAMPEIDYAQQHDYTGADLPLFYKSQYRDFRHDVPQKPLVAGELGYNTAYDRYEKRPFEWETVHFHNGLWAPLFAGYAGTALYWWWDLMVDPQNLWPGYKGIARFTTAAQESGGFCAHTPKPAQLSGGDATAMAMTSTSSALFWVRSDLHDISALKEAYRTERPAGGTAKWTPPWTPIKGAAVQCGDIAAPDGKVKVRWMDTHTGEWLPQAPAVGSIKGGVLAIDCPEFDRDIAAIVTWSTHG